MRCCLANVQSLQLWLNKAANEVHTRLLALLQIRALHVRAVGAVSGLAVCLSNRCFLHPSCSLCCKPVSYPASQAVGAVSGLASGLTEHLVPTAATATASSLGSGERFCLQ